MLSQDYTLCTGCPLKDNCERYVSYEHLSKQKDMMYIVVSVFMDIPYDEKRGECEYLIPIKNKNNTS